jgi:hypothetical protein
MYYLSFDIALKSLAYTLLYMGNNPNDLSSFRVLDWNVVDLCPDFKKSELNTIEKIRKTKKFIINKIIPLITPLKDIEILLEYQMQSTTNIIYVVIATLLSDYIIHDIKPIMKNKIEYNDAKCKIDYHLKKYSNNYSANKQHSVECMMYIVNLFELKLPKISHKRYNDLADSFNQIIAYRQYLHIKP